ncbi:MAG: hypothetical protein PHF67_02070 [Candidatus Nanoarchaeia archaeon]|nr:hypothetical protein [Candidatus Nanoarchaeia archaeon]
MSKRLSSDNRGKVNDEQRAEDVKAFMLKLSSPDSGLGKSEAVQSVAEQLRRYEEGRFFTEVFEDINPDNFTSTTKSLPEYQKGILRDAYKSYVNNP